MRGQPTLQHDCPCAYSSIYISHSQPKVLSFSIYCVYQLPVCYLLVTVNILFVFVVSHINSEYKETPKTQCFRGLSFFLDIRLNYRFDNEKSPKTRDLLVAVLHICFIRRTAHTFPELLMILTKKGQSL